jgi:hypothetical protein
MRGVQRTGGTGPLNISAGCNRHHACTRVPLLILLLCSGIGLCSGAQPLHCPCNGEEEIVGTVLGRVERDVSKLLTRVVNVTLQVRVDDVVCSQGGLNADDKIRVLYTGHTFGGRETEPVPEAGQRLRLCLDRFGTGGFYRPARPDRHFERLSK